MYLLLHPLSEVCALRVIFKYLKYQLQNYNKNIHKYVAVHSTYTVSLHSSNIKPQAVQQLSNMVMILYIFKVGYK